MGGRVGGWVGGQICVPPTNVDTPINAERRDWEGAKKEQGSRERETEEGGTGKEGRRDGEGGR